MQAPWTLGGQTGQLWINSFKFGIWLVEKSSDNIRLGPPFF